jgi:hypothetical protein
MDQLMALGVILGDSNSAAKAFADLRDELAKGNAAWEMAQVEVGTLTQAAESLKSSADKFAAQIPILEEKVKHLDGKVIDGLSEIRARELCLECTTKANDNYKSQNAQLTKKLESKLLWSSWTLTRIQWIFMSNPLQLAESDAELNALKAMVENVIAFFYPGKSSSATWAPQMLDSLPSRSWEIILANMKQSVSLTLGILKSLYPQADLDAAADSFVVTYTDDEALKLIEGSAVTAEHIVDMSRGQVSG